MSENADIQQIHALLARYARGLDTRDWELFRSVFTADAVIDYTASGGAAGPRDEVVDWLMSTLGSFSWTGQHYITNVEAEVDGDRAAVRAALFNPMLFPGMSAPTYMGGYYLHDLVRTQDGWRSRNLREEILWSVNSPLDARPAE